MPKTKCLFGTFWDAYAHKRNKEAAAKVWERLSDRDRRAALAGIAAYRSECQRTGVAMMYPQNYLRCRRWEDEIEPVAAPADTGGMEEW